MDELVFAELEKGIGENLGDWCLWWRVVVGMADVDDGDSEELYEDVGGDEDVHLAQKDQPVHGPKLLLPAAVLSLIGWISGSIDGGWMVRAGTWNRHRTK